jgi:multiple sugar transport system ATP-binding protein
MIEQVGTPGQLYERPDTIFVAGFIGSPTMNLIPATFAERGTRGAVVTLAGGQVIETMIDPAGLAPGAAVTLGVRPEHVATAGAGNRVSGTIRMVESLGAVHHVHVAVDGLAEPLVASLATRPEGETLAVSLAADCLHLFDAGGCALPRPAPAAPRAAA